MAKQTVSLTIMRAQPLHIGHIAILDRMLRDAADMNIVLVGSANESGTARNPFTYADRVQMIRAAMPGAPLLFAPLDDMGNIDLWVGYVLAFVWKKFGVAATDYYCGSGQDGEYFARAGLRVHETPRDIIKISATQIRDALRAGDMSVLKYIPDANQKQLIKTLTKGKK
jgi:nicotinic acid mononucleotide adenylyltransferase